MSENTVANSETIAEWCAIEKMSKAALYDLKRRNPDLAPKMIEIPGTRIVRVIESHEAWRARVAEAMKSKTAQLEVERRRELAATAGRIAATSPLHISKRAAHKQQRRRRAR